MNGTLDKMERYIVYMITDGLGDYKDIKQLNSFYGKANMLLRTFSYCPAYVNKCFPVVHLPLVVLVHGMAIQ